MKLTVLKKAGFCKLLFTVLGDFDKSLHDQHNKSCAKHEAKNVNAEEGQVGQSLVNHGEKGKCAVLEGADVEHIEGVLDADEWE